MKYSALKPSRDTRMRGGLEKLGGGGGNDRKMSLVYEREGNNHSAGIADVFGTRSVVQLVHVKGKQSSSLIKKATGEIKLNLGPHKHRGGEQEEKWDSTGSESKTMKLLLTSADFFVLCCET